MKIESAAAATQTGPGESEHELFREISGEVLVKSSDT